MQNNTEKIKLIIVKNENSNIYSEKDISLWLKEYFFYKYNKNKNVEFNYKKGKYGKPYFENIKEKFNISHSKEISILAISNEEIGIDIQYKKEISNNITNFLYSKKEQDIIKSLELDNLKIWTIKESFSKLLGTGIDCFFNNYEILSEHKIKDLKSNKIGYFKLWEYKENYYVSVCSFNENIIDKFESDFLSSKQLELIIKRKKKKLFAFDLDGTLLNYQNKVHPITQKALNKSNKMGNINVISTGRGLLKVIPLLEEIPNIDYCICSNGTLIYDVKNKKTYIQGKIKSEVFDFLYDFAQKNNLILTLDTPIFNGTWLPNNNFPKWMNKQQIMDMNIRKICSYEELNKIAHQSNDITQIALRNPKNIALENTTFIREKLKDYDVFLTNQIYTDVNPKGISKYLGIQKVIEMLDLYPYCVYAFGDSGNDIEMLKNAYKSFAMSNGTNEIKEIASKVIGDCNSAAIGEEMLEILNK
ncbi:HAD-IIB family hydrolase [Mycoplasmopsis lipophila]|uniref:HAD-IIB family hydrolase n=1 Tax=Mycoplasmopsis lipophila TaxID=2117 RepID=UPI003872ED0A